MKILFICTHNRCRSILSEAITNHLAQERIQAFSAGSQPAGEVHPLTLKYLAERGIACEGLKSQSWDDFESMQPDVVVTVCDSAASEVCPVWFGQTIQVHWGLPDPSKLGAEEAPAAFFAVMDTISARIEALLASNFEQLTEQALRAELQRLAD